MTDRAVADLKESPPQEQQTFSWGRHREGRTVL